MVPLSSPHTHKSSPLLPSGCIASSILYAGLQLVLEIGADCTCCYFRIPPVLYLFCDGCTLPGLVCSASKQPTAFPPGPLPSPEPPLSVCFLLNRGAQEPKLFLQLNEAISPLGSHRGEAGVHKKLYFPNDCATCGEVCQDKQS